jgi:hypothetical protein
MNPYSRLNDVVEIATISAYTSLSPFVVASCTTIWFGPVQAISQQIGSKMLYKLQLQVAK